MEHFSILFKEQHEKTEFEGGIDLKIVSAVVRDRGTPGARTSVELEMVDKYGNKFIARTTARLIVNGLAPATKGFMMRVGDNPELS